MSCIEHHFGEVGWCLLTRLVDPTAASIALARSRQIKLKAPKASRNAGQTYLTY
jgi:hypothetical protein